VQTSLRAIAQKAASQKRHRFRDLFRLLDEEMLKDCWRSIRKDAAYGVDRVSAREYEEHLEENIRALVERLRRKSYRAKLVRRHYIPKGDGKMRPLGIPATEDKLLQLAVTRILSAIYEQDFLRCSYGYRPNTGALDAVDKLTVKLQFGNYNWVVEADIRGFFDNISHEWMMKMLEERIDDRALLWLIGKWLKAGVLDTNGQVLHPATGTPQGGIISPVLANVYLHYALDLWFQHVVKKHCRGEASLIRYADDFVCAYEDEREAASFYRALGQRLGKFGLELSAEKTRVIAFGKSEPTGKGSFDFLGFEFRWGKDRKGNAHLKRKTSRKKLRNSLKSFAEWCKRNRQLSIRELFEQLNRKLRGYYNYYGVSGNSARLSEFYYNAVKIVLKWLNRRSQRGSYTWDGYKELMDCFRIEKPRITARRPRTRLATSKA
jgi:group II intron reverse transcriptase/maturase